MCEDIYIECKQTRVNPEAPVPLVEVVRTWITLGMAANVVTCLRKLNIEVDALYGNKSSDKTRYIEHKTKRQLLRVDSDPKSGQNRIDLSNINFSNYDAVVVSDYCKGSLTTHDILSIRSLFEGPIFLDTKKKDLYPFKAGFHLKINEKEAHDAGFYPFTAVITLGDRGAKHMEHWHPALKVEAIDVCGAGDAFLAGMVYGYFHDIHNHIKYGIVNAGISVQHLGTYGPTEKELLKGIEEYDKTDWSS